jgi:hypothetical protein
MPFKDSKDETEWEDVVVPQGEYIGWGEVGQRVTGHVVSYNDSGGTTFNGEPCPQVVLELTEECVSYREKGTKKGTIGAGEFVTITCGQANLERGIRAAAVNVGNLLRITYEADYKTQNGTGKSFKLQLSRTAHIQPSSSELV